MTTHSPVPKIETFQRQMEALQYQALFDLAPFGYIVTDPDGVIRQVNQAAASLLNAHQDRLAGKPVLHFVAQDDREELCSHLAQMAQHACVQDWEVCLQPRAKAPFAAAVTLAAVYDPVEGTLVGLCWIIRDATERPQAGETLHKSRSECEPQVAAHTAALTTANEQLAQNLEELRGAREAMAERLRFEALLAGLSTRFLNVSAHDVDQAIARGLQQIAAFLTIDRGTLLAFSEDTAQLRVRHAWTVPGFDSPPPLLPFDQFPWATERVRHGEMILFSRADELPGDAAREKAHLHRHGPVSAVVIPLAVDGSTVGAVAFSSLCVERAWPTGLVRRLRLIGEIFANALTRTRAEASRHKAFLDIQQLQQQLQAESRYQREEIKANHPTEAMVGQSDALHYVLFKVEQVAPYDTSVLLLGETGTGKELVARAIHALSPRRDRPLVQVNCAALPAHLIESELFGHEKGAFTGAQTQQVGRFDAAHGGTLLLDEIGELPLELQAKLLRVLQDGAFQRLGSPRTIRVDVRVIAATNRHLEADVRQGRFREDLYYRLQVFPITVPPLRDRREDIPLLAHALVKKFSAKLAKTMPAISPDTMAALQNYPWPGNVRELENVIERAVITTQGATLRLMETLAMSQAPSVEMIRRKTLEEVEIDHIVQTLEATHWRIEGKDGAAAALGLNPSTLRGRMQKHRIHRPPGRHYR